MATRPTKRKRVVVDSSSSDEAVDASAAVVLAPASQPENPQKCTETPVAVLVAPSRVAAIPGGLTPSLEEEEVQAIAASASASIASLTIAPSASAAASVQTTGPPVVVLDKIHVAAPLASTPTARRRRARPKGGTRPKSDNSLTQRDVGALATTAADVGNAAAGDTAAVANDAAAGAGDLVARGLVVCATDGGAAAAVAAGTVVSPPPIAVGSALPQDFPASSDSPSTNAALEANNIDALNVPTAIPGVQVLRKDAATTVRAARQYLRQRRDENVMEKRLRALAGLSWGESLRFHNGNKDRAPGKWKWDVLDQRIAEGAADPAAQLASYADETSKHVLEITRGPHQSDAADISVMKSGVQASFQHPLAAESLPPSGAPRTVLPNDRLDGVSVLSNDFDDFPLTNDAVINSMEGSMNALNFGDNLVPQIDSENPLRSVPIACGESMHGTRDNVEDGRTRKHVQLEEDSSFRVMDGFRAPRARRNFAPRRPSGSGGSVSSGTRWVPSVVPHQEAPSQATVRRRGASASAAVSAASFATAGLSSAERSSDVEQCPHANRETIVDAGYYIICLDCGEVLSFDGWRREYSKAGRWPDLRGSDLSVCRRYEERYIGIEASDYSGCGVGAPALVQAPTPRPSRNDRLYEAFR